MHQKGTHKEKYIKNIIGSSVTYLQPKSKVLALAQMALKK